VNIVVISAGAGSPSSTRKLADRMAGVVAEQLPGASVVTIDVRELAGDLVTAMISGLRSEPVRQALDQVSHADGVIAVTPVFNAAYSGLFKLFFDVLDEGSLRGVPVLLGATGGTARHSLAIDQSMVPLFYYLRAVPLPSPVFAATDDWADPHSLDSRVREAVGLFVAALSGGAQAPARPRTTQDDDFDPGGDFEEMLKKVHETGTW